MDHLSSVGRWGVWKPLSHRQGGGGCLSKAPAGRRPRPVFIFKFEKRQPAIGRGGRASLTRRRPAISAAVSHLQAAPLGHRPRPACSSERPSPGARHRGCSVIFNTNNAGRHPVCWKFYVAWGCFLFFDSGFAFIHARFFADPGAAFRGPRCCAYGSRPRSCDPAA